MGWTSVISMYVLRKQLDRSGEVMLYVLIIISAINGGQTVTTQEFTSEKNCMIALDAVKSNSRWATIAHVTCVQK
jgi:uncharacterized protein YegP (UPF0339 family)